MVVNDEATWDGRIQEEKVTLPYREGLLPLLSMVVRHNLYMFPFPQHL